MAIDVAALYATIAGIVKRSRAAVRLGGVVTEDQTCAAEVRSRSTWRDVREREPMRRPGAQGPAPDRPRDTSVDLGANPSEADVAWAGADGYRRGPVPAQEPAPRTGEPVTRFVLP